MRSQTLWPWGRAQLVEHVDGTGVDRDAVFDHGGQRRGVQQVGGEDDLVAAWGVSRRQPAADLAA